MTTKTRRIWYKALDLDELPEGRVKPTSLGVHSVCMTHFEGEYAALLNKCPHQGGPLGEGSIENGMLRCPWHGWDYHPTTGSPPDGYGDCVPRFPVEVREDGIYVELEEDVPHETTVTDVMAETLTNWGVRNVFGMVGHSNLGSRTRCAASPPPAASATWASATRAQRPSRARPTGSSPVALRHA